MHAFPPLHESELDALHRRVRDTGDPDARDRLIAHYLPFARRLASRLYRRGEPLEDLCQVAYEYLVRAIDRFDPDRGIPFQGFASPTIAGAIKRHFRDHGWAIRVPRPVHDLAPRLNEAQSSLSQQLGRTPTTAELAQELGLPCEQVAATLSAMDARHLRSLDAPVTRTADTTIGEQHGTVDPGFRRTDDHLDLLEGLSALADDDIAMLRRYYVDDSSQSTIAAGLGVSQMQVSRRLASVTARLRQTMLAS